MSVRFGASARRRPGNEPLERDAGVSLLERHTQRSSLEVASRPSPADAEQAVSVVCQLVHDPTAEWQFGLSERIARLGDSAGEIVVVHGGIVAGAWPDCSSA